MRVTLIDLWGREAMLHYTSQLSNYLAHLSGVYVTVLLPHGSNLDLFDPQVTIDFVDVVMDASARELLAVPFKLLKLPWFFMTIERTRPDVIHLNNCHVWYLFALPWLRQRYPIVSTLHDVAPHPGQDNSWRKRKEIDALALLSHRVFVHGEQLKLELLAKYPAVSENSIVVVPLGDFSFFTRYQSAVIEDKDVALFFGRIRAYRGLEYFIKAAKLVAQEIPNARFVIAGAGDLQPYRQWLDEDRIFEIYNCYIPDEQVSGFFRRSSIIVLPYIEASQSGVIPIAYAFGKAVVATRVGCLPDVIEDGETGLLVPPRNVPALAEAMIRLFKDDALRLRLGQNAHRKMKGELGWDKIAATTLSVYRTAIQEFAGD